MRGRANPDAVAARDAALAALRERVREADNAATAARRRADELEAVTRDVRRAALREERAIWDAFEKSARVPAHRGAVSATAPSVRALLMSSWVSSAIDRSSMPPQKEFLQWVHDHPDEVAALRGETSDDDFAREQAEHAGQLEDAPF